MSVDQRRGGRLAGASFAAAMVLICLAVGVHMSRRTELVELSKLAQYDRWGIPIDEAVDNGPDDSDAAAKRHSSRRTEADEGMLKIVQALKGQLDVLSSKVDDLATDSRRSGALRKAALQRTSAKQPVEKEVVKVVHDNTDAATLRAIKLDLEKLIAVDSAKTPVRSESRAGADSELSGQQHAHEKQEEEAKLREEVTQDEERHEEQQNARRKEEYKEVEERTMEAVKDAMEKQRAIDMKDFAAAAKAMHGRAVRAQAAGTDGKKGVAVHDEHAAPELSSQPQHQARELPEKEQPQATGRWGRRDGETFNTYMGRSDSHSSSGTERLVRQDWLEPEGTHTHKLATAVTASGSKLASRVGAIREKVLQLQNREQSLEGEERQALNELPEISNDEAHAESSVASTMQMLQIAKDRRVLAQRAVEDDHFNAGPLQVQEDRRTLIKATQTEQTVQAKLKDDLHALAQAKLDAKRGPILAQALHKVRGELRRAKDKLGVWDEVQEAQSLEQSKDFAAR
jgi:hypothetical protein